MALLKDGMAFLKEVRNSSVIHGYTHARMLAYKLLARESFTAWMH